MNVAFLHVDLGIGGAERLIVDAALELQARGHRATIFTSHHDPTHSFAITRGGELAIRRLGDFLPSHVGSRGRAPAAILRMLYLAQHVRFGREHFDVYFCDLVAHAIPLLKFLSRTPTVYYCHYPDRLLAPPGNLLYRLYRKPIDGLEEVGLGLSNRILVNSRFTADVLAGIHPRLPPAQILYPGVTRKSSPPVPFPSKRFSPLCLGRFDRKKNPALAIDAFAAWSRLASPKDAAEARLTLAGGFDERRTESQRLLHDLHGQAQRLGVGQQVRFVLSPSDEERNALLDQSDCVLFTADEEHFGYVPVEAMAAGRPVISVASGGPLETIRDGETGFLCPNDPQAFANRMMELWQKSDLRADMGLNGQRHVEKYFSRRAFGDNLCAILEDLA